MSYIFMKHIVVIINYLSYFAFELDFERLKYNIPVPLLFIKSGKNNNIYFFSVDHNTNVKYLLLF